MERVKASNLFDECTSTARLPGGYAFGRKMRNDDGFLVVVGIPDMNIGVFVGFAFSELPLLDRDDFCAVFGIRLRTAIRILDQKASGPVYPISTFER